MMVEKRIPWWLTLPKLHWIRSEQSEHPAHTPMHTVKCETHTGDHHKYRSPFLLANCVVGSTPLHSTKRPRRTDKKRSNTFDSTGVMKIGWYFSIVEEGGPVKLMWHRPVSCKLGNYPNEDITETRSQNASRPFKNEETCPEGQCHHMGQIPTIVASTHCLWVKGKDDESGRWKARRW